MREVGSVQLASATELDILRFGLSEIATEAPGSHDESKNPCYHVKRDFKEYAQRILAAGIAAREEAAAHAL